MGARGQVQRVWRFLRQVYGEFSRDNCALMAAAISFYVLLSLIPLLLVGLSAFGYVLGREQAAEVVFQFLDQFLPKQFDAGALHEYLKATVVKPARFVGLLGLVSWVWAGSVCFLTITEALDIAWASRRRRGFVAGRLVSMGMMVVVGLLMLVSFGTTQWIKIIREFRLPVVGWSPGQIPVVWQVVGWAVPAILSVLIFVLCYVVLPGKRIGWRHALIGGGIAGVLWDLAKQGFAVYVANFVHYDKIYGTLSGLVFLVMWVYYSAAILLLGGEIASVSADWRKGTRRHRAEDSR